MFINVDDSDHCFNRYPRYPGRVVLRNEGQALESAWLGPYLVFFDSYRSSSHIDKNSLLGIAL